jgi:nucleoid-associated protein YgaU
MSVAIEIAPTVTIPEQARPAPVEAVPRLASVTVLHPPREVSAPSTVRLTRRGVVVLAVAVAAFGAGLVWLARLSAPQPGVAPPATHSVTVRSGDTLWAIATRVAPDRDPRAEVAALERRNHLSSVDLVPGQVLRVP